MPVKDSNFSNRTSQSTAGSTSAAAPDSSSQHSSNDSNYGPTIPDYDEDEEDRKFRATHPNITVNPSPDSFKNDPVFVNPYTPSNADVTMDYRPSFDQLNVPAGDQLKKLNLANYV